MTLAVNLPLASLVVKNRAETCVVAPPAAKLNLAETMKVAGTDGESVPGEAAAGVDTKAGTVESGEFDGKLEEIAITGMPAAGVPSGKRRTPDRTAVLAGNGNPATPEGAAGTKLEKSIASTSPPDATVTTRAAAASVVPG